jgi:hypothetical protein
MLAGGCAEDGKTTVDLTLNVGDHVTIEPIFDGSYDYVWNDSALVTE